jgi:hypothetical protein
MDMVMMDKPTAHAVWTKIQGFFTANKPSRAVHQEAELHALEQGDLSVSSYCHQLQVLANALADCDAPITDRALVHQLIRGLDKTRFGTLKTMLPALPQFPTFVEARDHLLREERSLPKPAASQSTDTALVASDASNGSTDSSTTRHENGARDSGGSNGNRGYGSNNNRGYGGRNVGGRGNGGRGGYGGRRGGGRGGNNYGGRSSNNNNSGGRGSQYMQPAWIPYYPQWGGRLMERRWRALARSLDRCNRSRRSWLRTTC